MVDVAKFASNGTAAGRRVSFWCPGCKDAHQIVVETETGWHFNGDLGRPTFTPSVLVHYGNPKPGPLGPNAVCHSFVTDGQIQFLGDSTHALAGQTVALPPWPYAEES